MILDKFVLVITSRVQFHFFLLEGGIPSIVTLNGTLFTLFPDLNH